MHEHISCLTDEHHHRRFTLPVAVAAQLKGDFNNEVQVSRTRHFTDVHGRGFDATPTGEKDMFDYVWRVSDRPGFTEINLSFFFTASGYEGQGLASGLFFHMLDLIKRSAHETGKMHWLCLTAISDGRLFWRTKGFEYSALYQSDRDFELLTQHLYGRGIKLVPDDYEALGHSTMAAMYAVCALCGASPAAVWGENAWVGNQTIRADHDDNITDAQKFAQLYHLFGHGPQAARKAAAQAFPPQFHKMVASRLQANTNPVSFLIARHHPAKAVG
jgi:hypothetical protein